MTILGGGLFLIEVETAPNVWVECADLTRVQKANNVTISRTRVFRKTYRRAAATDRVYTLSGLLNYADPGQAALLAAERTNTPIRIRWSEEGSETAMKTVSARVATITHDSDPDPATIQTVSFELRTSDVPFDASIVPTSVASLLSTYNQLGASGSGATMKNVWQRGINQTIAGGFCTKWDDAVAPGGNAYWRPSPETPAGAKVGGDGGTSITDVGLELPAAFMDTITAQVQADLSSATVDPITGAPAGINSGQTINGLFVDRTKGFTLGSACKMIGNTKTFSLESGGADDLYFNPDQFANWITLADPLAAIGNPATTGSARMGIRWFVTDSPNSTRALNWQFQQFGRDLLKKGRSSAAHPLIAGIAGRRLRLHVNGGAQYQFATAETNFVYLSIGRETKAQNKLVTDYMKAQFPDLWEDPRTRLAINLGDSFQDGIDGPIPGGFASDDIGIAHDVLLGHTGRNLARLPDCAFFTLAFAGDSVALMQYNMGVLVADLDFTSRTRVALLTSEFLNGSNTAQNYYLADFLRAADAKIHTVLYDLVSNTNINHPTNYPAFIDDLDANFAAHADGLLHIERGPTSGLNGPWTAEFFGDGTTSTYPTGQNPLLWATQHPTVLFNQLFAPLYQAGILKALGDDTILTTKTTRVKPTNRRLSLTAGAPTGGPGAIVAYGFADTVLAGKTYTYDTVIINGAVNAGWSSGAAIATVDAGGTVTRVAAGHCALRITANDGQVGYVDVICT